VERSVGVCEGELDSVAGSFAVADGGVLTAEIVAPVSDMPRGARVVADEDKRLVRGRIARTSHVELDELMIEDPLSLHDILNDRTADLTGDTPRADEVVEKGVVESPVALLGLSAGRGSGDHCADSQGENGRMGSLHLNLCVIVRVRGLLAKRAYVPGQTRQAYKAQTASTARKLPVQLASWLERGGHEDAAGSLREGLEETLTVLNLGLSRTLTRSLSTTNAVENVMSSIRRTTRNVKRWRNPSMIRRYAGARAITPRNDLAAPPSISPAQV